MINKSKKVVLCAAVTTGLLVPMTGASAHYDWNENNHRGGYSKSHDHSRTSTKDVAPEVASYTIKHTSKGAVIEGKLDNVSKKTKLTFRASAKELNGQTGFYEWKTTDRDGNFRIEIRDFKDAN